MAAPNLTCRVLAGLAVCTVVCAVVPLADAEDATAMSPQAADALLLVQSDDPYQQQLGFLRLEALREPATLDAIRVYVTHQNPDRRAYSLRALAAIEGAAAVPQLLDALRSDSQPRVRQAALLGLEPLQSADPAILPAYLQALNDRSTDVRITAVDIVSRIDDDAARDAIRDRFKRERRRDVRRALDLAMSRLGGV